jgi:hypothetical protein
VHAASSCDDAYHVLCTAEVVACLVADYKFAVLRLLHSKDATPGPPAGVLCFCCSVGYAVGCCVWHRNCNDWQRSFMCRPQLCLLCPVLPALHLRLCCPAAAHNGGYSFKFMSKSAVHAGSRRFRRVTKSGKLIMARRQAPHMAGQVRTEGSAAGRRSFGGVAA